MVFGQNILTMILTLHINELEHSLLKGALTAQQPTVAKDGLKHEQIANLLRKLDLNISKRNQVYFIRWDNRVEIKSAMGGVTLESFSRDCEDNDFSLNASVTGHLMLIDDRAGLTYIMNDHYVDVIETLNEKGNFTAPLSPLEYSLFV